MTRLLFERSQPVLLVIMVVAMTATFIPFTSVITRECPMLPMLSIPQRLISESAAFRPSTPQSELWLFAVTTALNPAAATAEIKVDGELQLGAPVSSRSCSNSNGARSILVVSSTPAVKSAPERISLTRLNESK